MYEENKNFFEQIDTSLERPQFESFKVGNQQRSNTQLKYVYNCMCGNRIQTLNELGVHSQECELMTCSY